MSLVETMGALFFFGYDGGMIGIIKGTVEVLNSHTRSCVVLTGGIGYEIALTNDTAARLSIGQEVVLRTHLAVREDALDLYGFLDEADLTFFKLLLSVSGIGPKSALGILDVAPVEILRTSIATSNLAHLTSISGIGKKTAEKIILELRDKLPKIDSGMDALTGDVEALEAMRALGYSVHEARDALRLVPQTIVGGNERLREALRLMSQK